MIEVLEKEIKGLGTLIESKIASIEDKFSLIESKVAFREDMEAVKALFEREISGIKSEIANIKILSESKITKDEKKELVEFFKKALTTPSASHTIPESVADQVQSLANVYGIARRLSNVVLVETQKLKLPVEGSVTVYWPNEGVEIPEGTSSIGGIVVEVKKAAGYAEISRELMKYSNVSIIDYLLRIFSKAISKEEDRIFIRGSGTDPFTGIVNLTPANVKISNSTNWDGVTLDEIIELTSLVDLSVSDSPDAVFIMHSQFYTKLLTKKASGSGEYIVGSYIDPFQRTLLGKKIIITDLMPSDAPGNVACIFGDFKQGNLFAISQDLVLETSVDYAFKKDNIAVKLIEMISPINIGINNTFTYLKLKSS